MSKIEQYPIVTPETGDKIIITQVNGTPPDATKNVTVQGILDLVPPPPAPPFVPPFPLAINLGGTEADNQKDALNNLTDATNQTLGDVLTIVDDGGVNVAEFQTPLPKYVPPTWVDTTDEITTVVSSAQLLNLQSVPVDLVPAPGADKYLKVLEVSVWLEYSGVPYVQNGDVEINAGGDFQAVIPNTSGLLTATQDEVASLQIVPNKTALIGTDKAIQLTTGNAITGGTSKIHVKVKYQTLKLSAF